MDFLVKILKCVFILHIISIVKAKQKENGCKYPSKLQIVFLVDGSLRPGSNWSVIQTEITKEVTKLTEEKYFPDVEYGLAAYYTWKDDKSKCYSLIQPLSSNPNDMLVKLELPGERGNNIMTSECGMSMALLLTVTDNRVRWDTSLDDTVRKIVIAYTLKPSVTEHPKGKIVDLLFRRDAIGDMSDSCENSNPPSAEVLRKTLEVNKVIAFLEVILPFKREGTVGHFYSRTEGSPFFKFTNEVTCTQYYGRANTVTALSNYWTPESRHHQDPEQSTGDKIHKHILQVGPGIREEDIKLEDMLKRAKILFNKCFMRRICVNETRIARRSQKHPMSENYKFAGKHPVKLIWASTSNCTGSGKPQQIVFLVDAALPKGSKWPIIQEDMIKEIAMILQERDSSTEFALVAYFNWKDMKGKCYNLLQPFTTNAEDILPKISSLEGEAEPLQDSKCSMTMALVLSLHDPLLNWSEDKQKILIAFPLRASHTGGGATSEPPSPTTDLTTRHKRKSKNIHDTGSRWKVIFNEQRGAGGGGGGSGAGGGGGGTIDGSLTCDKEKPPSAEELKQEITDKKAFVIVAAFLPETLEESVGHSYSAGETSPFKLFSNQLMCASWYSQNNSITARPSMWNPDQWQQTIPVIFHEIMGSGLKEESIQAEDISKRALFLIKECFIRNPVLCTNTHKITTTVKPEVLQPMPPGKGNGKQVVFMVDASLSKTSKWPLIQQEMVREVGKLLHEKDSATEFALVAYYSWKELKGHCYTLLQTFTPNLDEVLSKISTISGGEDTPSQTSKCSLTMAIILSIKDSKLHWTNDKQKVIIGFPLRGSHGEHENAGKGSGFRRMTIGDGSDSCENSLPPSAEALRKAITENNVHVVIATFLPNSLEEIVGHSYSASVTSPLRLLSNELVCAQWYSQNNSVTARASLWKPDQWQETIPIIFHEIMGPGLKEEDIKAEDMKKRALRLFHECFIRSTKEPDTSTMSLLPQKPLPTTTKGTGKQVVFMADASLSKTSKWPIIQQEMVKEVGKLLHSKDATVKFALVAYYSWKDLTGQCYTLVQGFTANIDEILNKMSTLSGGDDIPSETSKCSMTTALVLAIKDKNLAWSTDKQKVVITFPLRGSHGPSESAVKRKGSRRAMLGDGSDTCENSVPPSAEVLKKVITESGVWVVIATFLPNSLEEIVGHSYSASDQSPLKLLSTDLVCAQWYSQNNSVTARPSLWSPDEWQVTIPVIFHEVMGGGLKEEDIKPEDMKKRALTLFHECFIRNTKSTTPRLPPKPTPSTTKGGSGKQVVFMADASLSKTSKWPIIQQDMAKEVGKLLHSKDATVEFALVAYYSWKDLTGQCYSLIQGFTANIDEILNKMSTLPGGDDVPSETSKCSMTTALVLAIKDTNLHWSSDKLKVIIAFPLRGSHGESETAVKRKGSRRAMLGDGSDTCENSVPPSADVLKKVIMESNVWVIIATFLPSSLEEIVGHSYSAKETSPLRLLSNELVCAQWYSQNNSVTARASLWNPDQWQETIPVIFHEVMGGGLKEEDIKSEDMKKRALTLFHECFIRSAKLSSTPQLPMPTTPTQKGSGKQVVFMVDASLAKTSKWPVIQQEMVKEISKILHQKDATMEFALVAYYSWKELKGQCYSLLQDFTINVQEIISKISTLSNGEDLPAANSKCSLTMAIVLAIKDTKLAWSADKQKVVISFPLRGSYVGEGETGVKLKGSRRTFSGDGTDNCENSLPPSAEVLKKVITENNVWVIIATFLPNSLEEIVGHSYSAGETSPLKLLSTDLVCAQWYSHNNSVTARPSLWKPDQWQEPIPVIFHGIMGPGIKEEDIKPEDMKKRAAFLVFNCFTRKFNELKNSKAKPSVALSTRMAQPFHMPTAAQIRTEGIPIPKGKKAPTPKIVVEEEVCSLEDSELPNLQILFLVDGSLAHGSNWSKISQDMTKEMTKLIEEKQKKSGAKVEFAVASYFSSHGDQSTGGKCYALLQTFTKDTAAITQKIGELGHSHTDIYAECSLTLALLLAVKDKNLHWNDELITVDSKTTRKFIIAYPMRVSSITGGGGGGSGAKRDPLGDGTDTCENSTPPKAEALKQVVYTNNVYVIIGTFLLQGKEEQVGNFYSTVDSSPFKLYSEDTACFTYFGAQNSITARRNTWMNNKMTPSTKTFKFATAVGLGFKEDNIDHFDILKRAELLYQNCFLPELVSCDWEDPPGYNTFGL